MISNPPMKFNFWSVVNAEDDCLPELLRPREDCETLFLVDLERE